MNDQDTRRMIEKARQIAAPYGSMHPLWDLIADAEALLDGRTTIMSRLDIEDGLIKAIARYQK